MTRPVGGTVLEPTVAPGPSRRARRGARARRRARRRFWFVALPISALLVAAIVVVGERVRPEVVAVPTSTTAPPVTEPVLVLPAQTLVFAHLADDGVVGLAGFVVVGGAGPVGDVVLVPSAAVVDVPAVGAVAVGDLVREGGTPLLATGIEQAFAVRVDEVALLDDLALDDVLRASTTAGGPTIDPGALVDPASGRVAFEAWMTRLRDPARGAAVLEAAPALSVLVLAAQHDATVSVAPLAADRRVDAAGFAVLAELPNDARLGYNGLRPTVELLDGRGNADALRAAAGCLVHSGADIVEVDDVPAYSFERTAITYHDEVQRSAAEMFRLALGTGEVSVRGGGPNAFDVTVYIGADFEGCIQ